MLKAKGLWTFPNYLSAVPEGALLDATNCVIDRDGIIEPRRGINQYGNVGVANDRIKQLLTYKNRILAHYNSVLAYDNGSGTFTDFSGVFSEVEAGLRIKAIELNGNCYVTTGSGIKKIASNSSTLSSATISDAGGAKALDVAASVNYTNPGWFLGYSKVAYRVVWGINDVNNNLILGSPSSRTVVVNYGTASATVDLTFPIPDEVTTTDYFYQVYRTSLSTSLTFVGIEDLEPGDEMKLVFEDNVTSAQLTAGEITINDITPADFQLNGAILYTNPVSGDGILQANEKPPLAKDISVFKNSAFYGNIQTKYKFDLTFLGTGGLKSFGAFGDAVTISSITATNPAIITFTGVGHGLGTSGTKYITIVGSGAAAVDATHLATITSATTLTIPVNGTGANAATTSIFTSYIEIVKGLTTNRYFFVGRPEISTIISDIKANTTDGSYFLINSAENQNKYFVWYDKTGTTTEPSAADTIGRIGIRVNISAEIAASDVSFRTLEAIENNSVDFELSRVSNIITITTANSGQAGTIAYPSSIVGATPPGGGFSILVNQQGFGEDTSKNYIRLSTYASTAQSVDDTARSLVNVINQNSLDVVYGYYLSGPDDIPGVMNIEARDLDGVVFTIQANEVDVGALFNPNITVATNSVNETNPNRLYFSKAQQPEAVPIVNYFDIGPKDKKIIRIIGLRDSLFIFKEDGIYRLTGEIVPGFSVTLFDGTTTLIAPDSVAVLNNQIYSFTEGGISTVTETGVGIVSRPIENRLTTISTANYPNFSTATFGMSYETDRSYLVWTITNIADTYATQCFRYNTFTQTWTRWDKPQRCGLVNSFDDKIYVGAVDLNTVEKERKLLTRKDYSDRQFNLSIPSNPVIGNDTLLISSAANVEQGDAVIQIQYVTINSFNNLLLKLDADPRIGVTGFDTDYYATLVMTAGDNITNSMQELVAKLNADPGTDGGYLFSGSTNFVTIQTEYNTMITAMNADMKLKFNNYQSSTGTIEQEMSVTDVNTNTNYLSSNYIPLFMVGPVTHYKGLLATVVWSPMAMGDPTLLKHIRESTVLFENTAFQTAMMGYNTDLSPNFESIEFTLSGNGSWGAFNWGETTWGGEGTAVPFRTYIPRQKQRCRFIRGKFQHFNAFDKFAILGISYVYEPNSERAYK